MPPITSGFRRKVPEYILAKIKGRNRDSCWTWTGLTSKNGSPLVCFEGNNKSTTRLLYYFKRGKQVPRDKFIVRTCGNVGCVNPYHGKMVDRRGFDIYRAEMAKRCHSFTETVCVRGHKKKVNEQCVECRKDKSRRNTQKRRFQYWLDWLEYLYEKFGRAPKCQVCRKELHWRSDSYKGRACLDHRMHGREKIQCHPAKWLRSHRVSDENIAIFESCNFGILCVTCNSFLPTLGRKKFMRRLNKYCEET